MLWSSSGHLQGRVFFALKKTRASGRNVGKVFNPVVKLVLENQTFLMLEPAEKPSLQIIIADILCLQRVQNMYTIDVHSSTKLLYVCALLLMHIL